MEPISVCPSCGQKNRTRASASGSPRCGQCNEPLPWLVSASSSTFDEETRSSLPVLVDFWAPWCGPCRAVAPVLEALAKENAGRLKVVKVDVDDNPELARRYRAMSIPTLLLLKNGKEVSRMVGAQPKPTLQARLQPHLA